MVNSKIQTIKVNRPAEIILDALTMAISAYPASNRRVTEYPDHYEVEIESKAIPHLFDDSIIERIARLSQVLYPSTIRNAILSDIELQMKIGNSECYSFQISNEEDGYSLISYEIDSFIVKPELGDNRGAGLPMIQAHVPSLYLEYTPESVFTIKGYLEQLANEGFSVTCATCGKRFDLGQYASWSCQECTKEAKEKEAELLNKASFLITLGFDKDSIPTAADAERILKESDDQEIAELDDEMIKKAWNAPVVQVLVAARIEKKIDLASEEILKGISDGSIVTSADAKKLDFPDEVIMAAWDKSKADRIELYWNSHSSERDGNNQKKLRAEKELSEINSNLSKRQTELSQLKGLFKRKQREEVMVIIEDLKEKRDLKQAELNKINAVLGSYPPDKF